MDHANKPTAILIWAAMSAVIILGLFYAPVSQCVIPYLGYKIHFVFILSIPSLAVILIWIVKLLFEVEKIPAGPTFYLGVLIFHCLVVVLLTGGISNSPLSSIIAMIPLLASPFIEKDRKKKLLLVYLIGVVAVGVLSTLSSFTPPTSYTEPWKFSGGYNVIIATAVLMVGITLEIFSLSLAEEIQVHLNSKSP